MGEGCKPVIGQDVVGEYVYIDTFGKTQQDVDGKWVGDKNYTRYINISNTLFSFNFIFMNKRFGYSFSHIQDPDDKDLVVMLYFDHKLYLIHKCYEIQYEIVNSRTWILDLHDKDDVRRKIEIHRATLEQDVKNLLKLSKSRFYQNV
jgi:hypothetical protein